MECTLITCTVYPDIGYWPGAYEGHGYTKVALVFLADNDNICPAGFINRCRNIYEKPI